VSVDDAPPHGIPRPMLWGLSGSYRQRARFYAAIAAAEDEGFRSTVAPPPAAVDVPVSPTCGYVTGRDRDDIEGAAS
jgi:hypothetical protein